MKTPALTMKPLTALIAAYSVFLATPQQSQAFPADVICNSSAHNAACTVQLDDNFALVTSARNVIDGRNGRGEVGQLLDIDIQFPVFTEYMHFVGKVNRVDPKKFVRIAVCGVGIYFQEMEKEKEKKFFEVLDFSLKQKKDK